MMTIAAVLLFAVILKSGIEADAGSFNLSGSFDPGISFGRTHSLHQRYQARNGEDDEDDFDWPHPTHINNFEVPESVNDTIPNETGFNDNEPPQAPHHESHRRTRRH